MNVRDLAAIFFLCLPCLSVVSGPAHANNHTDQLRGALEDYLEVGLWPDRLTVTTDRGPSVWRVEYSLDHKLQTSLNSLLQRYRPDYASIVAIEPKTGAVLAMVNFSRDETDLGNLALRSDYPAASVYKIVTAAAALESGKVRPETITPFNGKRSSLYRSQVLRHKENRWTHYPTFKSAFAKSINTVFARLGIYSVGAERLNNMASRLGFNQAWLADFPFEWGRSSIQDDSWHLAETSSGFTTRNTLSPVHAALIASTIINDGRMPQPFIIKGASSNDGHYQATPKPLARALKSTTAQQLRELMVETVTTGSARRAFNQKRPPGFNQLEIGGKSGSLTGFSPYGKHDWFVGYARGEDKSIAFAALTINKEKWTVKSAYLARKLIEAYFSN